MSSISFGGIVSGLDTGSIVSQLVALRRRPIVRLEAKKTDLNRSIAALDDLKAALAKLDAAAKALDTEGEFNSKVGRSGNEDLFTATANSKTPSGVYQITVDRLGDYAVNDRLLVNNDIRTLVRALEDALESHAGSTSRLIVTADANATHQAVVRAMDAAGKVGISRISITTQQPTEE